MFNPSRRVHAEAAHIRRFPCPAAHTIGSAVERPRNVLVVEDDAAIRTLIKFLVQRESWTVEEVSDGQAALAKITGGGAYDAIVLDLMLPGLSGEAILAELRRSDPAALRRIVIVTASPSFVKKLDTTGVGAIMVKPFDIDQLIAALRACTAA